MTPIARSSHRTKAEQRMDALNDERYRLLNLPHPTTKERMRLVQVQVTELPKARRAVQRARELEKQGRRH